MPLPLLFLLFADPLSIPAGLDAYLPVPDSNPLTREKVELGKRLFFDKRLSHDQTISCATCHDPKLAFTDANPVGIGIGRQAGNRRAPRLVNRGYGKIFFWDGRAPTLEDQVIQPILNPKEMDLSVEQAAARVALTPERLQQALASYVRTILSGDSPYDRYVLGNPDAITPTQRLGLRLFRGKAGCASCHPGPNFTDEKFHNTGVGWPNDPGRAAITATDRDRGGFKTPGLREVTRTPPYMHDGSLKSIEEVIEHYDKGGTPNPSLDPEIHPLHLTAAEKAALATFLQALNGTLRDGF